MKKIKRIAMMLALMLLAVMLTACGGDAPDTTAKVNDDGTVAGTATDTLNIVMYADLLNEDAAQQYVNGLKDSMDMFKDDVANVNLTCIMTGGDADPTMQMAGIMKMSVAIAAQEVDIIIADADNAARDARAENYYALSEILTAEQIAALEGRVMDFEETDFEGNLTGGRTPAYGVNMSDDAGLQAVFGNESIGVFVAGNAPNLENAKALLMALGNASVQ